MSRRCQSLIVVLSFAIAVMLMAATAVAKQNPVVKIAVNTTARENVPTPISWSGKHLGKGHRLVIQRPVGTARIWRTVMPLKADRGTGHLPPQALGEYQLRIAALLGGDVIAKRVFTLPVFGVVSFADLIGSSVRNYATPTSSFPYVSVEGPTEQPALAVRDNRCISAHVEFVPGQQRGPGTGTVTLVQETRDPVAATAAYDTIGSLDAELTPGETWALNTTYFTTTPANWEPDFYVNGSAVCSTRDQIILYR
jgi:hypothetical protein